MVSSILTRSITIGSDDAASPGPLASKRAVQRTQHGVHPSKELNMQANVSDQGRAPDMPQRNAVGKPTSQKTKAPTKAGSAAWLVAALLLLSAIPLAAGAFRLTQLAGGADITPANARFFASPLPVVLHIVGAAVYIILGAFQFAPTFRRRWPGWHRAAGRLLVPCGLLVGLSALWMTLFYPWPAGDGALLYALRLLFGSAMVVSIVLGFAAIRRGDVRRHRARMMRGYALGLGRRLAHGPFGHGQVDHPARAHQQSAADGRGLGDQPGRGRMGHAQAAGQARARSRASSVRGASSRPRAGSRQSRGRSTRPWPTQTGAAMHTAAHRRQPARDRTGSSTALTAQPAVRREPGAARPRGASRASAAGRWVRTGTRPGWHT